MSVYIVIKLISTKSNMMAKKKIFSFLKSSLVIIFVLTLVILFSYSKVFFTFYQQDEWQTLGHNLSEGIQFTTKHNIVSLLFGEIRPLSGFLYLIIVGFYKFTVFPAFSIALFVHTLNTILVFHLAERLSKNRVLAILAGLFFALNNVSHQSVTWISAHGTLFAATFLLIAILSYLNYFEKHKKRYLFYGLAAAIISMLFKGVGLFLFILLPLMFFIFEKEKKKKNRIQEILRLNASLASVGVCMLLVRLSSFFTLSAPIAGYTDVANNTVWITVAVRTILYPLTALFQIFVPPLDLYSLSETLTRLQYKSLVTSPAFGLVAQSSVADMLVLSGSFFVLAILGIFMFKETNTAVRRSILFSLLILFLSMLPYIFLDRDGSYFSGRYYYVSLIPVAMLFGYIVVFLQSLHKYMRWVCVAFVFFFLFHHVQMTQRDIAMQVAIAYERKTFLNEINRLRPTLTNQTVFYIHSDKKYLGEITYPFQNGLGYILQVWYYDSDAIPKMFLQKDFLWDLGSEGYRTEGKYSFGYFEHIDLLSEYVQKGIIQPDIIYGYRFDSLTHKMSDITDDVRTQLATLSATIKL